MASSISKEKIKELTILAQSQKLIPEENLCYDGVNGNYTREQEIATMAFMILQKAGIYVQVEFDN